jgi:hypothetical protein
MDICDTPADTAHPAVRSVDRRRLLAFAAVAAGGAALTTLDARPAAAATNLGESADGVTTVAQALAAAQASSWGGFANGRIPTSALTPIVTTVAGSGYLRSDAARQYLSMSLAFSRAVGRPLIITEGYRTYARQQDYWNRYQNGTGNLAAYPGTSNHGWAISCDFGSGVETAGTTAKRWMDANAPSYGWKPTGNGFSRPEPWHFDYVGAWVGNAGSAAPKVGSGDVVVLRSTQAIGSRPAGYTALLGIRSLRHLSTIDMINSMRVVSTPYFEVNAAVFTSIMASLSIPTSALVENADYWRR